MDTDLYGKCKIMILTASYGEGHNQAAGALRQQFVRQGVRSVQVLDLLAEAHPFLNSAIKYVYLKSSMLSTTGLDYYGWSYYATRNMTSENRLIKPVFSLGARKLKELISTERPDAIISTFPHLDVSEICRYVGAVVPTFTVLTDFALHNRWILSKNDKFYVATDELRDKMIEQGIPADQVKTSGIPIRHSFYETQNIEEIRRKYDLNPNMRTTLVLAGAYGVMQFTERIVRKLAAIPGNQVVVVCGKNERLKTNLTASLQGEPRIKLLGYVENMHELMAVADCAVTKAGGITLSEAIQMNMPPLIFKPFPGQERENAKYLAGKGAAIVSNDFERFTLQATALLSDPEQMRRMKQRLAELASDRASECIVTDVLHTIRSKMTLQH
ncbi:Processive diacylglycerol beta-glucosyltransferase [Paenibacillus sp. CECT 9249]|nr:Processive diacylglycerol beta-glucosyltransferase [Paenibacillus sp. CECT 9249]